MYEYSSFHTFTLIACLFSVPLSVYTHGVYDLLFCVELSSFLYRHEPSVSGIHTMCNCPVACCMYGGFFVNGTVLFASSPCLQFLWKKTGSSLRTVYVKVTSE